LKTGGITGAQALPVSSNVMILSDEAIQE